MSATTIYYRARPLMEAELGDELVTLDVDGGHCYGFNAVATSVWRLLEQPCSAAAIHRALIEEYDVAPDQCAQELSELIADLSTRGLIRADVALVPDSPTV